MDIVSMQPYSATEQHRTATMVWGWRAEPGPSCQHLAASAADGRHLWLRRRAPLTEQLRVALSVLASKAPPPPGTLRNEAWIALRVAECDALRVLATDLKRELLETEKLRKEATTIRGYVALKKQEQQIVEELQKVRLAPEQIPRDLVGEPQVLRAWRAGPVPSRQHGAASAADGRLPWPQRRPTPPPPPGGTPLEEQLRVTLSALAIKPRPLNATV